MDSAIDTSINIDTKNIQSFVEIYLEILKLEFEKSPLFDGEQIETKPSFPDLNNEFFDRIIETQFKKLIPFILKNFLETENDDSQVELPPELYFLLTSPEVCAEKKLMLKDYFRFDSTGTIVFSLWYKGKICKQIVFDPSAKYLGTSTYFYTDTYIFEHRVFLDGEIRIGVYLNDENLLLSEAAKDKANSMNVVISSVSGINTFLRRSGVIIDDNNNFMDYVEEVHNIRNPDARRITLYNSDDNEEMLVMTINFSKTLERYVAYTKRYSMDINDETKQSRLYLTKTMKVLDDLISDSAVDLIEESIGHMIVYRSFKIGDMETNKLKQLFYTSKELLGNSLEIFFDNNSHPSYIVYGNKHYNISEAFSPKENYFILYLGSKLKYVQYSLATGFPSNVRIIGIQPARQSFKNPKSFSHT